MSELQKELLSMIIIFNDETLKPLKQLLENKLDEELLKIDSTTNIKELTINEKIDLLKSIQILNDSTSTISYEEALKSLGLEDDTL